MENYTEIKLNFEEKYKDIVGDTLNFPKYTTQLLNLANQNSGGTKPAVVGQLSELINESPEKTLDSWKQWYFENYPDAIDKATEKISPMIENLKEAINKIDDDMIKKWVEDLVITKTAEGLIIQEAIFEELAKRLNQNWRNSTAEEESKNIDGYIGDLPIQVKGFSYLAKKSTVRESINCNIVYYKKTDKYLYIYSDLIES